MFSIKTKTLKKVEISKNVDCNEFKIDGYHGILDGSWCGRGVHATLQSVSVQDHIR